MKRASLILPSPAARVGRSGVILASLIALITLPAAASAIDASAISRTVPCAVLDEAKCPAFKEIIDAGAEAMPAVVEALKSSNQAVRARAARIAGRQELGSAEARSQALLDALKGSSDEQRGEIIQALGRVGHASALPTIAALAKPETDGRTRSFVASALSYFPRNDVARTAAESLLNDEYPRIQLAAAVALGRMADVKAVPALIDRALTEITPATVREAAARSLGQLGDDRALAALGLLVASREKNVQKAAIGGLGQLRSPAAVPLLIGLLPDEDLSAAVIGALGQIGGERALGAIATTATSQARPVAVRKAALAMLGEARATDSVAAVVTVLRSPDLSLVRAAAEALGRIKAPGAVSALAQLVGHADPEVAKVVQWALQEITGERYGTDAERWRRWQPPAQP